MKDKTLLKVGGILAIVIGALYCITILGAIVGIPLIIGGIKFKDISLLKEEEIRKQKDTILIWSIVFLLLSLIPGVLGLAYFIGLDQDTNRNNNDKTSKYDELEKLKKLYDDKAITKAEYEEQKKKILSNI